MIRLLVLMLVAMAVYAGEPVAEAQVSPGPTNSVRPSGQELERARAHFKAAEAAKARREYKTAAVEYLAAYELFQEPEFFFNVAEVYRLAGEEHDALTYYEKYLELDPNGRGVSTASSHADRLRRSIAAKEDSQRIADEARRKVEEEARRARDEEMRITAAQAARHSASSGRNLRVAGIATGSAGVVAIGIGVSFALKTQRISDEIADSDTYDPRRFDEGEAAARNARIFMAAGAAALVTGGVLYYLGHRARWITATDTTMTWVPIVEPSQITIATMGRF